MRKAKKIGVVVLGVVLLVLFIVLGGSLYIYVNELAVVSRAPYRVSVPSKPGASGVLYRSGTGYLLVLTDRASKHLEDYYLDLDRRQLGLPYFEKSKYVPLRHYALVDENAIGGFVPLFRLAADWAVSEREVHIRITGSPPDIEKADPSSKRKDLQRLSMPIAFETDVVLSKVRWE